MCNKLFVALCLFGALVQAANCRSTRDAVVVADSTTTNTLSDLVKQTDDAFKTLQTNFLSFMGAKDTAELSTVLQTQTKSVADKLQATVTQIVEEAKDSQASEQVKGFADKLTKQINDWKRENPDVVLTAETYKDNLEKGLRTVATETQDLSAKLAAQGQGMNENLQKILHQVYDDTLTATKTVSTQIEAVANKQ